MPPAPTECKQTLIQRHRAAQQGRKIATKVLISLVSLSFPALWDIDRKSVNSSQWQLHGFCIINYLYQARHSNYHPDEYDILISHALILIALQHLTVSGGLAWWSEDSPKSIRHLPEDHWLRRPLFLPLCVEINTASLYVRVRSHPSRYGLPFVSQMKTKKISRNDVHLLRFVLDCEALYNNIPVTDGLREVLAKLIWQPMYVVWTLEDYWIFSFEDSMVIHAASDVNFIFFSWNRAEMLSWVFSYS